MKTFLATFFLLTLSGLFAAEHKVVASDNGSDDELGFSSAISGEYFISGAPYHDTDGNNSAGAAYIFKNDGSGNWIQNAKLKAPSVVSSDYFASTVSISGNYVIVGSLADGGANDKAYIYKNDGSDNWSNTATLTVSYTFGQAVAISGDYAIIGLTWANSSTGSAYIYKKDSGAETWSQKAVLTASDGANSDYFGESVSISGDYVVIGAYGDDGSDDSKSQAGAAYIFKRDSGLETWTQTAKLQAGTETANDQFSLGGVSISGTDVVIGSTGDNTNGSYAGAAYVFKKDTGVETWSQTAKLLPNDGGAGDHFGSAVSISGTKVIVGANQEDAVDPNSGSAYLFTNDGSDNWSQTSKITASDAASNDEFGESVAVSSDYILIGSHLDDVAADTDAGSAYLYDLSDISLPVELSAFSCTSKNGSITLEWVTSSEIENLGFEIERRNMKYKKGDWELIASYKSVADLLGQGSTTHETSYGYIDKDVRVGESYDYRLVDVDYQGKVTLHDAVSVVVRAKDLDSKPNTFKINSVYPNPFNPMTTLNYTLEQEMQISVGVLDLRGREVVTLQNRYQPAGEYELSWNGLNANGLPMQSGIYFLNIQGPGFNQTVKIVKLD